MSKRRHFSIPQQVFLFISVVSGFMVGHWVVGWIVLFTVRSV